MTLTIAPPDLQSSTASSAIVVSYDGPAGHEVDELAEEPMDYTPIARGRLAAPDYPDEPASDDDGTGPMGY